MIDVLANAFPMVPISFDYIYDSGWMYSFLETLPFCKRVFCKRVKFPELVQIGLCTNQRRACGGDAILSSSLIRRNWPPSTGSASGLGTVSTSLPTPPESPPGGWWLTSSAARTPNRSASGRGWNRWYRLGPPPIKRPGLRRQRRRRCRSRCRRRCGCRASCRPTNAATQTGEVSCAGGGATPRREEANRDRRVRIRKGAGSEAAHGAAAAADGAAGEGRDKRSEN